MATFSKRTLRELGDVLSDFSSLNPIARLFEDADIAFPRDDIADDASRGITGQRRTLVAQYIAGLDLGHPDDIRKLLRVFDEVFAEVLGAEPNKWTEKARKRLLRYLNDDGFVPRKDGRLAAVGVGRRVDIPLDTIADIGVLGEHLDRIDREVDSDPAGAISAAKALIESTAKIVLRETGGTWAKNVKFPVLVSSAQKALGLMAADKAGDVSLQKILDGLYKVAIGIDELRNRYGRDHGRDAPLKGIGVRHARLAVHAGTAYCRFLLDTLTDPKAPWRKK